MEAAEPADAVTESDAAESEILRAPDEEDGAQELPDTDVDPWRKRLQRLCRSFSPRLMHRSWSHIRSKRRLVLRKLLLKR